MKRKLVTMLCLVLMLSLVLTPALITGSADSGDSYSFTAMVSGLGNDAPDTPTNLAWQAKLNEMMGMDININWIYTPGAEYDDKMKVLLGTGELPDYFMLPFIYDYVPLANEGVFLDLAQYEMTNYLAMVDLVDNGRAMAFTERGLLPALWTIGTPSIDPGRSNIPNNITVFNVTAFEREGIEMPVTLNEWYEAAKAFKAIYPNSYPINMNYLGVYTVFQAYRIYSNEQGAGTIYWDGEQYTFSGLQPEFKYGIEYLRKLHEEELLDPEYIIETVDTVKSKMFNEINFMLINSWESHAAEYTRDVGGEFIFAAGINMYNDDPEYGVPFLQFGRANMYSMSNWSTYAVNANVDRPEIMAKIVDLQFSPELYSIAGWGVEGLSYELDADGSRKPIAEILDAPPAERPMLADRWGIWYTGKVNPGLRGVQFPALARAIPVDNTYNYCFVGGKLENTRMVDTEFFTNLPWPNDYISPWFDSPNLGFTDEEATEASNLLTILQTYTRQMQAEFISGQKSMSEWDAFIESFENDYNYQRILDIYNGAAARYFAAQ